MKSFLLDLPNSIIHYGDQDSPTEEWEHLPVLVYYDQEGRQTDDHEEAAAVCGLCADGYYRTFPVSKMPPRH